MSHQSINFSCLCIGLDMQFTLFRYHNCEHLNLRLVWCELTLFTTTMSPFIGASVLFHCWTRPAVCHRSSCPSPSHSPSQQSPSRSSSLSSSPHGSSHECATIWSGNSKQSFCWRMPLQCEYQHYVIDTNYRLSLFVCTRPK